MGERMEFPESFEKFAEDYGFKDNKEVYTNGSDLIPIFRVKQWLEHDNKLRTTETGTILEGHVVKAKLCYQRKTYVKPVIHDYSDKRHPNSFKYSCPVCDSLGNPHQVSEYEKNCPLCNVNLYWAESGDKE